MGWVVVALVLALIALGAFTVYRVFRSWMIARAKLKAIDPPRSRSA